VNGVKKSRIGVFAGVVALAAIVASVIVWFKSLQKEYICFIVDGEDEECFI